MVDIINPLLFENISPSISQFEMDSLLRVAVSKLQKRIFNTVVVQNLTRYVPELTDNVMLVNSFYSDIVIQLPICERGKNFIIKRVGTSNNSVTVKPAVGQTIDGSDNMVNLTKWSVVRVVSDGVNWFKTV